MFSVLDLLSDHVCLQDVQGRTVAPQNVLRLFVKPVSSEQIVNDHETETFPNLTKERIDLSAESTS